MIKSNEFKRKEHIVSTPIEGENPEKSQIVKVLIR